MMQKEIYFFLSIFFITVDSCVCPEKLVRETNNGLTVYPNPEDKCIYQLPNYPHLAISNIYGAGNVEELLNYNVVAILSAVGNLYKNRIESVKYVDLQLHDSEDQSLEDAIEELNKLVMNYKDKGVILVHCAAGVSRSASILIGHLIQIEGLTYENALAEMRSTRPVANPNTGFVKQLLLMKKDK